MRACCLRAGLCVRVCISRWVRVTPCAGVCHAARPGHPGSLATLGSRCPVPGPDPWWCPAWLIACCVTCLLGGSEGGCGGRDGGGRGDGMGSVERPRGARSPWGLPACLPAHPPGLGVRDPVGACVRACVRVPAAGAPSVVPSRRRAGRSSVRRPLEAQPRRPALQPSGGGRGGSSASRAAGGLGTRRMRGCGVRRPGCGQGEAACDESWSVLGGR